MLRPSIQPVVSCLFLVSVMSLTLSKVDYLLSLLLPFLSHVTRQSMACSPASFPPPSFTSFLSTYSVSMLVFSSFPCLIFGRERVLLPCLILSFVFTFFLSVLVSESDVLFTVAWAAHAIPSSLFWPLSFHYVHKVVLPDSPQSRSSRIVRRFHLAMWSLQGDAGDIVGCLYTTAFYPSLSPSYLVPTSLFLVSVSVSLLLAFLSCRRRTTLPPLSSSLSSPLSSLEQQTTRGEEGLGQVEGRRKGGGSFLSISSLLLLLVSDTSLKSASYFASNYLPNGKETGSYLSYNIASICGTIASGVFFSLDSAYASVPLASALLVTLLGDATKEEAPVLIGFLVSFCSTTLSICICSDLSSKMGKRWKKEGAEGRVTSLLDGVGSLVASFVQLIPVRFFLPLQWVCASLLLVSSLLLLTTTCLLDRMERRKVGCQTLPFVVSPLLVCSPKPVPSSVHDDTDPTRRGREEQVDEEEVDINASDDTGSGGRSPPRPRGRETDPSSGLCGSAS